MDSNNNNNDKIGTTPRQAEFCDKDSSSSDEDQVAVMKNKRFNIQRRNHAIKWSKEYIIKGIPLSYYPK